MPRRRRRVIIDVGKVPAFGYAVFHVLRGKALHQAAGLKVSCGERRVENEYLCLQPDGNGALRILDKKTGRRWSNLNAFEDIADVGDEYNYAPPEHDLTVNSADISPKWEFIKKEPLRAGFRIRMELPLPKAISDDRKSRNPETVPCYLETTAMLNAKSRRVDVLTRFRNNARDHNLRVLFPSGARTAGFSDAMGTFDVVRRPIAAGARGPDSVEDPPSRHPMDGFVNVSDKNGGLFVCGAGLHEYEVKNDVERTIAVTLLRAVGWLSRSDLGTRKGDAGPSLATPGAQCPGEHVFRYCLIPHDGDWERSAAWKEIMEFLHPVRCITLPLVAPSFEGNRPVLPLRAPSLPEIASLLTIEPVAMILSAVKKAENRNALIVRAWNIGARALKARFIFARPVRRAYSVNLAERRLKRLVVKNTCQVAVPCKPKQIVTIEVLP